jgi:hypothetical protein
MDQIVVVVVFVNVVVVVVTVTAIITVTVIITDTTIDVFESSLTKKKSFVVIVKLASKV